MQWYKEEIYYCGEGKKTVLWKHLLNQSNQLPWRRNSKIPIEEAAAKWRKTQVSVLVHGPSLRPRLEETCEGPAPPSMAPTMSFAISNKQLQSFATEDVRMQSFLSTPPWRHKHIVFSRGWGWNRNTSTNHLAFQNSYKIQYTYSSKKEILSLCCNETNQIWLLTTDSAPTLMAW